MCQLHGNFWFHRGQGYTLGRPNVEHGVGKHCNTRLPTSVGIPIWSSEGIFSREANSNDISFCQLETKRNAFSSEKFIATYQISQFRSGLSQLLPPAKVHVYQLCLNVPTKTRMGQAQPSLQWCRTVQLWHVQYTLGLVPSATCEFGCGKEKIHRIQNRHQKVSNRGTLRLVSGAWHS